MLLAFRVKNFLSFKDEACLDLKAATINDFAETNLIETPRYKVLKSAVIYGANSSGKSNLIKAVLTTIVTLMTPMLVETLVVAEA